MRNLILPALLALSSFAAEPAKSPVVPDKVPDRFTSAALGRQHIDGLLGSRMRVNLEGRLLNVDEKAIIDCFEHRPGPQDWAGEHAGKFLHAAANTWLYTDDQRLKTLMDRMARELIATQLPDGYLGTYTDDKRWTSWDVWVHKYDLLGLLAYYQATGYQPALDASRKIGDLLVPYVRDRARTARHHRRRNTTSAWPRPASWRPWSTSTASPAMPLPELLRIPGALLGSAERPEDHRFASVHAGASFTPPTPKRTR